MNGLQVFNNDRFGSVRTLEENGKVLFCGSDVAKALGYTNPSKALNDHCRGITKRDTPTTSGIQYMSFIPEGDVYRLITHSKLPAAQEFEGWIFDEVLPSIRQTGAYMTPETIEKVLTDPDTIIKLATQIKELQAKVRQDAPKVLFAAAVEASDTTILVGELAKLLRQNGIEMGQNRLFRWLRENGYLMRNNIPTQYSMELGLFEIKERTINNPDGSIRITQTPKVTGKGQTYFVNKLLGQAG